MSRKVRWLTLVAASLGLLLLGAAWKNATTEPDKQEPTPLSKFMRAKLAASEKILEGLCVEDFDLIAKGAAELTRISSAEQWRISNDALYREHSQEFRRIAAKLEKAAKNGKLDAAALTWLEATMSCIECHRHVRTILMAEPSSAR